MSDIAHTLNLLTLAKGNPEGSTVPGTDLEVAVISEKRDNLTLEHDLWLLVLEGELIIDLPFGDFRTLKVGECLHLEAGLKISYQPLEDAVVLRRG